MFDYSVKQCIANINCYFQCVPILKLMYYSKELLIIKNYWKHNIHDYKINNVISVIYYYEK